MLAKHLKMLDIFIAEVVESNKYMVENNIIHLLPYSENILLYINTKKHNLLPNIISLMNAQKNNNHNCDKLNVFVNLDYSYEFTEDDVNQLTESALWKMSMWPNPKINQAHIACNKFTFSIGCIVPYADANGVIYDVEELRDEMESYLLDKYQEYKEFQVVWSEIEVALDYEEQHEFDLWCEFVLFK